MKKRIIFSLGVLFGSVIIISLLAAVGVVAASGYDKGIKVTQVVNNGTGDNGHNVSDPNGSGKHDHGDVDGNNGCGNSKSTGDDNNGNGCVKQKATSTPETVLVTPTNRPLATDPVKPTKVVPTVPPVPMTTVPVFASTPCAQNCVSIDFTICGLTNTMTMTLPSGVVVVIIPPQK